MIPGGRGPLVTVDGPAGSGKSTTAREVARRLGFRHLDSGALYRALTLALLDGGVAPERWPELDAEELGALGVGLESGEEGFRVRIGPRAVGSELREPSVTGRVSLLAGLPAARACLLELQRAAGREGRLVADGRDMGTVVFPDADVKVFLVADLEERARRRLREHGGPEDDPAALAREAEAIAARDRLDSERSISPLERAPDAHLLDTTELSPDQQVEHVVELVRRLTLS